MAGLGLYQNLGMSRAKSVEENAGVMADHLHSRMALGAGTKDSLKRREVRGRPEGLPLDDSTALDIITDNNRTQAELRNTVAAWIAYCDTIEYDNASRLQMLIWAVELYDLAKRSDDPKRAEVIAFCLAQFGMDPQVHPPEYDDHANGRGGPYEMVKYTRRFDICSKSIRSGRMVRKKPPPGSDDFGGGA